MTTAKSESKMDPNFSLHYVIGLCKSMKKEDRFHLCDSGGQKY